MTKIRISASLMTADQACLGDAVRAMDKAGIDAFHLDIMDGHFVPNFTFSPAIVKALRPLTKKFFEVHLMVTHPENWIAIFADAGADAITFHIEAVADPRNVIALIKSRGLQAWIALNPETGLPRIEHLLPLLDGILFMTIHPGFAQQDFIDVTDKIRQAVSFKQQFPGLEIAVDGGVNEKTGKHAIESGATYLVSANWLFKQQDYAEAIALLKTGQA